MKYGFVFFDWNGTIVRKERREPMEKRRVMAEAMSRAIGLLGGEGEERKRREAVTADEFYRVYSEVREQFLDGKEEDETKSFALGDAVRAAWSALGLSLSEEEAEKVMSAYFCCDALCKQAYCDAAPVLAAIHAAGIPIGLIRNSKTPKKMMVERMEKHGLAKYFSTVVMSGEVGAKKPSPVVFSAAVREAGLEKMQEETPERIMFIGNETEKDVVGANAMGWTSVLVCHTEEGSGGEADHDIASLHALLPILGVSTDS